MNNFLDSTSEKILSFFRKRKEKHRFSFAVLNDVIVQRWVIAVLLSAGLTALLAPQFYSSKPVYRHGMIVQENVKADRDFLVEDVQSTRLKQLESAAAVRPVYDYDPETAMTIRAKIKQSFALAAGQRETSQVKALLDRSLGVTLSQEEFAYLSAHAFSDELLQRFSRIIFAFYENTFVTTGPFGNQEREKGITIVNTLTRTEENTKELSSILLMKDIGPALSKKINASMRNEQPEARRVTFLFLKKMIAPNLTYNPKATAQKIASARESVKPVYFQVQKNEMIVREGDKIGYPELAKLEAFHKTAAVSNISSLAVLAGIFCIGQRPHKTIAHVITLCAQRFQRIRADEILNPFEIEIV